MHPKPVRRFPGRRLAREWDTVAAMIRIYCRDQHGKPPFFLSMHRDHEPGVKMETGKMPVLRRRVHGRALCPECQDLASYVSLRLDHCRFGETKPTCAKCPVHCYQRERRERIKEVMRYAGPRMIWEHPWLSLRHWLDGRLQNQAAAAFATGLNRSYQKTKKDSLLPSLPFCSNPDPDRLHIPKVAEADLNAKPQRGAEREHCKAWQSGEASKEPLHRKKWVA